MINLENLLCPVDVFLVAIDIANNDEDAGLYEVAEVALDQAVEEGEIATVLDGMQLNLANHLSAHFKVEAGEDVEEWYQVHD